MTHYEPMFYGFDDETEVERTMCGVRPAEKADYSGDWEHVNCGRCQHQRTRLSAQAESDLKHHIADMASFVAFAEAQA